MMQVKTQTSTYLIDREAMTVSRHPGDWEVNEDWQRVDLRRDTETMRLIDMKEPIVGQPLLLLIDLREDGVLTYRQTTAITQVEDK